MGRSNMDSVPDRHKESVLRILLVEDNYPLGSALRDHLSHHGHAVDWFTELGPAQSAMQTVSYGAVLLDLGLPDGDGLDFVRHWKRPDYPECPPILILTARDQLRQRIAGLDAGADDYLVKPFSLDELSARLRAIGRRYHGQLSSILKFGAVSIDLSAQQVTVDGEAVLLTPREWAVLSCLAERPQQLRTRAELEDALYRFGDEVESNTIQVHISHLRKKLGAELIYTMRGAGYRLSDGQSAPLPDDA